MLKNLTKSEAQFIRLWTAEFISALGSSISSFAFLLWVYAETNNSALLGFLMFAYLGPQIYLSLFGGHIIDRVPGKGLLIITDFVQLLGSVLILILFYLNQLNFIWILGITLIGGISASLQSLVFITSMRLFLPNEKLLKYNGLIQLIKSVPAILAPLIAYPLLQHIKLSGVVIFDLATFIIGILILFTVKYPNTEGPPLKKFNWTQTTEGLKYIFDHPKLKSSLNFFMFSNFLTGLVSGLIIAFIIEKAGKNSSWVSYNSSLTALGLLLGSVLVVKFADRINKPYKIMAFVIIIAALSGRIGVALVSIPIAVGLLLLFRNATLPLLNACNDTIWQLNVDKQIQGRVFGARRFAAQGLYPIGLLIGPSLIPILKTDLLPQSGLIILFLAVGVLELLSPIFIKSFLNVNFSDS